MFPLKKEIPNNRKESNTKKLEKGRCYKTQNQQIKWDFSRSIQQGVDLGVVHWRRCISKISSEFIIK